MDLDTLKHHIDYEIEAARPFIQSAASILNKSNNKYGAKDSAAPMKPLHDFLLDEDIYDHYIVAMPSALSVMGFAGKMIDEYPDIFGGANHDKWCYWYDRYWFGAGEVSFLFKSIYAEYIAESHKSENLN